MNLTPSMSQPKKDQIKTMISYQTVVESVDSATYQISMTLGTLSIITKLCILSIYYSHGKKKNCWKIFVNAFISKAEICLIHM